MNMGQSRISSHLSILKKADLVTDRKEGKKTFYSSNNHYEFRKIKLVENILKVLNEEPEIKEDKANLDRILENRKQNAENYFNSLAGRLRKNYCPGRTWEAIGHFFAFLLTPKIRIADLGSGFISQLLARNADKVICIDNAPKMIEFGRNLSIKNDLSNLEYILGDIESVPLGNNSVDLALLSQALHHASSTQSNPSIRILDHSGRIVIIDLAEHNFENARKLYSDVWLGFPKINYTSCLKMQVLRTLKLIWFQQKKSLHSLNNISISN